MNEISHRCRVVYLLDQKEDGDAGESVSFVSPGNDPECAITRSTLAEIDSTGKVVLQ